MVFETSWAVRLSFFFCGVALVLSRKFASGPGIFMISFCHDFSLEGLD